MANRKSIVLTPENQSPYLKVSFFADKEALSAFKERIKSYGETARNTLDDTFVYNPQKGIVIGSNPFAAVEIASSSLALPSQLEHAVRIDPDFFKGTYEDPALVLRTDGDSYAQNDFVAKHLTKQVKHRIGMEPTPENPAMVSLRGLSLKQHKNSPYGLVFMLGELTEVIHAPELSHKNNGKNFSRTDERGIPIFDGGGSRTFYSRNNGLSRLCLDRGLGLNSVGGGLSGSGADGRVVVCAEGASHEVRKIFEDYTAKLELEKKAIVAALEERYQKALLVLKNN